MEQSEDLKQFIGHVNLQVELDDKLLWKGDEKGYFFSEKVCSNYGAGRE